MPNGMPAGVVDPMPLARVHGGTWARLRSFVLVGPQRAAQGLLRWAVNAAMSSALVHFGVFLVLLAYWLPRVSANVVEQILAMILLAIVALIGVGIHWVVTLAAMLIVAPLGRFLARVPRGLAQVLGAATVGLIAWLVEPIALVHWHADLFRAIAFVLGAFWGAWLPIAGSCRQDRATVDGCESPV